MVTFEVALQFRLLKNWRYQKLEVAATYAMRGLGVKLSGAGLAQLHLYSWM
jgi:hypothetical protein